LYARCLTQKIGRNVPLSHTDALPSVHALSQEFRANNKLSSVFVHQWVRYSLQKLGEATVSFRANPA
jgi:hypothetical protein